VVLPV